MFRMPDNATPRQQLTMSALLLSVVLITGYDIALFFIGKPTTTTTPTTLETVVLIVYACLCISVVVLTTILTIRMIRSKRG